MLTRLDRLDRRLLARGLPPLVLVALMLLLFTRFTWPGRYPPVLPDSMDYQQSAVSLLQGGYSVH